jgi:hypothetical protein
METFWLISGVSLFSFVVNLPFGWLRSGTKKFSFLWFLYIHLPVPLVIVLRITTGSPTAAIPLFIIAAVLGQLIGARWAKKRLASQT